MTTRLYFKRVAPDSQRLLNLWLLSNINILQKLRTKVKTNQLSIYNYVMTHYKKGK